MQQVEQRAAPHPLGDQTQRLVRLEERVAEELHHARVLELAEELPLLHEAPPHLVIEGLRGVVRVRQQHLLHRHQRVAVHAAVHDAEAAVAHLPQSRDLALVDLQPCRQAAALQQSRVLLAEETRAQREGGRDGAQQLAEKEVPVVSE